ncbi:hypothetical protein SAMN05660964_00783 [Thiothrix caldifontis]|uniref:Uncharacterized protein n=1 Tax=Thiothrix caldifontis TaxID=525918 RepID=A0A1H3XRW7_9GAMM|nr:hypothetical protein [Thiothrix caldifontis]SEA01980.1 hypothetical protein SAMN05660964_00783 [Thiothrix caldifontis]
MTDETKTTDTTPENSQPTAETVPESHTSGCRWSKCRPFGGEKGDWHGKHCCKKKLVLGIIAIALLSFFAGKGCSHHHDKHMRMGHMEQPSVTQAYNGRVQQMPLSMMLDGIAATPDQRAKAVNLLH